MKRKSPLLSLTVVVALFAFGGCASESIIVRMEQTASMPSIPEAGKVNLYVERFSDVRGLKNPHQIGEGMTGLSSKSTPVISEENIEELSARVVGEAFSKAGFNVVTDEEKADLVFKGSINAFWVQEVAKLFEELAVADVEFDVVLVDKLRERNIWSDVKRNHAVTSGGTMNFAAQDVTRLDEETLNEALNGVIESIVGDAKLVSAVKDFTRSK